MTKGQYTGLINQRTMSSLINLIIQFRIFNLVMI